MEDHCETRTHLTDEQFANLLLGAEPSSVQDHLKVCPQCSEEAERVSGAIGSFRQQSRLWAERRAASQPRLVPRSEPAFPWLHRPQAWTAAALAIILTVGFGISIHNSRERSVQPVVAKIQPAATVTPATLKADNELLSAISGELRADASAPATMYGLDTTSHGTRLKAPKRLAD